MTGPLADLALGAAVFLALLAGAWVGSLLLPDHMPDGDAKEVVYEAQRNDLRTLAADVINLDNTRRLYGAPARAAARGRGGDDRPSVVSTDRELVHHPAELHSEKAYLTVLGRAPANEIQMTMKAQALRIAAEMSQSRLRLCERSQPDLPGSLIFVLSVWMVCLFISFSLFSR